MQYLVLFTRIVLKVLICVNHERLRPHLLGELRLPPNMLQPAMSVFQRYFVCFLHCCEAQAKGQARIAKEMSL